MSLVTCCREICSEQGGRAIGKKKKRKENSDIDSEWRFCMSMRPHILLSSVCWSARCLWLEFVSVIEWMDFCLVCL